MSIRSGDHYLLFTNGLLGAQSFVRPELAGAMHKSEGFVFPSKDRVTGLVNSL